MTSYVSIPNGDVDQDSPVTQPLLTALRDNPIAIAEGASGAPLISGALTKVVATTEIGSFIFARGPSTTTYGSTVAGSSLIYAGAISSASASTSNSGSTPIMQSFSFSAGASGVPAGTWRCLGHIAATGSGTGLTSVSTTITAATLWQRIA